MQKRVKQGKPMQGPTAILLGIGVSVTSVVAGVAVIAYLVHKETLGQANVKLWLMVALALSATIGSIISSAGYKGNKIVGSIAAGVGFFTILLLANVLLFGGEFTGFWVTLLMVALGVSISMLPVMHKKGGKRKFKIPVYR